MSRRGGYLGGHTVLTQRRSDFERTLAEDAIQYQKDKVISQRQFDQEKKREEQKRFKSFRDLYAIRNGQQARFQREILKLQIQKNPDILTPEFVRSFKSKKTKKLLNSLLKKKQKSLVYRI